MRKSQTETISQTRLFPCLQTQHPAILLIGASKKIPQPSRRARASPVRYATHLAKDLLTAGGTPLKVLTEFPTLALGENAKALAEVAAIANRANFFMSAIVNRYVVRTMNTDRQTNITPDGAADAMHGRKVSSSFSAQHEDGRWMKRCLWAFVAALLLFASSSKDSSVPSPSPHHHHHTRRREVLVCTYH